MKTLTADSPKITAAEVERLIRSLTAVEKTNIGIEVTVPVAYGDGELVTVVVEQTTDALVVHDASFSAMRLSNSGISFTPNVVHRLAELAARYGCKFHSGRVGSSAESIEALPHVVALVANAARSVADYAFEVKRMAETDFRLVVVEKLREIVGSRARDPDEFKGASGRRYRLPFVLNKELSRPEHFISTLANRSNVPQVFAAYSDLRGSWPGVERDAVYDDAAHLRDEDRTFLKTADTAIVFGWMEAERRFKEFVRDVRH
ncbi:hypothetical protein [Bradyrhizobium sp.]|uniref:hypothetical protein n=1 Tax=Bradyrhizobium sp. TaxID=376 RepID=UPI001EB46526|nr:hypothetical protein [Bradyrhizobium sp.]MBV8921520.1 hypothetical protein [Bradyrhizobium sp.]MBV9986007.1 hypothetical protein [Bradyrhizobium sp.]